MFSPAKWHFAMATGKIRHAEHGAEAYSPSAMTHSCRHSSIRA